MIMETNKFNGTSYNDWLRNLRIVLYFENRGYVLDKPLLMTLPKGSLPDERVTLEKWLEDNRLVRSIILVSMTNDIQKQYDRFDGVPSIMIRMKEVYAVPDRHIRYTTTKAFLGTKMAKGSSVQSHEVKMLSLVEKLEDLKTGLDNDTYIDVILQSLPPSYDQFIINHNMNRLENPIHELINMLVRYEATTHKFALAILVGEALTSKAKSKRAGRWKRKKGKGKAVAASASAEGAPTAPVGMDKGKGKVRGSQRSRANDVCMHCKERGIGRRSAHNSSPTQVLERSRRLSKDVMILRLGDGKAVAAKAVGSLNLVISDYIRIELKNCYYPNWIMTTQHKWKLDNHDDSQIRHARLGHISKDMMRKLVDSKSLEDYALETTTKLLNMVPSKIVPQTPYEIWHGKPASYKYLRVWGSPAYIKRLVGDKLDSRSSLCRVSFRIADAMKCYLKKQTPPKGVKPVGCKWVYKRKLGADGEVTAFKARLVGRRIHSTTGVDFEETYLPVAMAKSIRILLAIAACILHGSTGGFTSIGEEQKNEFDPCVYKKISRSTVAYLVLYVDDILLIGNDVKMMDNIKAWLSTQFSMKDMGETSYILGIKIYRDRSRRMLGLTQSSYIEKVLRFKMENSKRGFLAMRNGIKLSKKQSPKTDEENLSGCRTSPMLQS
ncbi:UNVERIFIED_CONTAM: hypothetical protein Slati_0935700 [Sesamum latifolium]|uniref:Reverse transcriptase Ty1/copia-type domain-containing protein n=1 Tax=Sesamum latifolium TaxID=2727402 RepID=A0AAW2XPL7_9LAMI